MNEREHIDGYSNDHGAILPMFALCVMLLAIFAISFSIDIPLTNTTATRLQNALDTGAMECLNSLIAENSNDTAATKGRSNAAAVLGNTYSPDSVSYKSFTEGSGGFDSLIVAIPQREGSTYEPLYAYDGTTSGTTLETRAQNVFSEVFDPGTIDDFKNACMAYGKFSQKRYFSSVFEPQSAYAGGFHDTFIELASVAMIKPVLNYILMDPAFSGGSENYEFLFGANPGDDGTTDSTMWPIATDTALGQLVEDSLGSWSWPSPENYGYMNYHFYGNETLDPSMAGGGPGPGVGKGDYFFYKNVVPCNSLPWYYYKSSVVGLIDRFKESSAFSTTTMIGITGNNDSGQPVTPVHPKSVSSGLAVHDVTTPFPPLHTKYSSHWEGYINSANLLHASSGNVDVEAGVNTWALASCRALYVDAATATDYLTPEDMYGNSTDDPELDYNSPSKRRRGAGSGFHWVDDNLTDTPGYTFDCKDTVIDLGYGEGGNGTGGESPRTLIGNMRMRVYSWNGCPRNFSISQDTKADGTSPNGDCTYNPCYCPSGAAHNWIRDEPDNGPSPSGERDLGYSIGHAGGACDLLSQAVANYEADNALQGVRPHATPTLNVFAFGIWDEWQRQKYINDGTYATNAAAEAGMANIFKSAIIDCVCNKGIRVEMAMLPLNNYDMWTVAQVQDVFTGFQDVATHYFSDSGVAIPAGYEACDASDPIAKNNLFIYDYRSSRYDGYATESAKKLAVSRDFWQLVPELLHRLSLEFDSPI